MKTEAHRDEMTCWGLHSKKVAEWTLEYGLAIPEPLSFKHRADCLLSLLPSAFHDDPYLVWVTALDVISL